MWWGGGGGGEVNADDAGLRPAIVGFLGGRCVWCWGEGHTEIRCVHSRLAPFPGPLSGGRRCSWEPPPRSCRLPPRSCSLPPRSCSLPRDTLSKEVAGSRPRGLPAVLQPAARLSPRMSPRMLPSLVRPTNPPPSHSSVRPPPHPLSALQNVCTAAAVPLRAYPAGGRLCTAVLHCGTRLQLEDRRCILRHPRAGVGGDLQE